MGQTFPLIAVHKVAVILVFQAQKKGKSRRTYPLYTANYLLDSDDMFSLQAFLAIGYNELYALTFSKAFETFTDNCAEVSENVWA